MGYVLPVRAGQFGNSDSSVVLSDSPDPVDPGQEVTYTATVKNNGPRKAISVELADDLPISLTYVSSTSTKGTCAHDSGAVFCNIGDMANGAIVTVTIKATAAAPGLISNTVSVSSASTDNIPDNNTAVAVTIVNTKPTLGALSPSTITTEQGQAQSFAAVYKDADGATNLKNLEFLVTPDGTVANGIRVRYARATNKLSIFNDAGMAILQTCTQGAVGTTMQNAQGSIDCEATTISTSGTDITVNWNIIPKAAFASETARQIRMRADDKAGATTGWVKKGAWTINP
jgi:uncharacterized repeat protein (TIGR01451 family)